MNTQTALQKSPATQTKPSALTVMASRLSVEPSKMLDMLKATVFQKASNEECMALVVVSNEYGLNPLLKEIYAFPAKGGGIVPVVGIDGWNKMMLRNPEFDGIDFEYVDKPDGTPHSCTVTVFVKNRSHPVRVTEFYDECHRNTDPWNNMPRRMLRNRTLCQGARLAFGFSGVYDEDEAIDIVATVMPSEPLKAIPAPRPEAEAQPERQPENAGKEDVRTPQQQLESVIVDGGFTFNHFQKWGIESGNISDAGSIGSFAEVPADTCKRLLRATTGLLKNLAGVRL